MQLLYVLPGSHKSSEPAPVILSAINVHVILLFQTNKPDDDDDQDSHPATDRANFAEDKFEIWLVSHVFVSYLFVKHLRPLST